MNQKPNILFLFSDQHNTGVLGCYGNEQVHTPHLDRLAREGVRFENAYCQNPICTPSRMSFMSGQYVHNHGYYGLMGPKPENLPNLFSHFKNNGYATGVVGKIHTPSGWLSETCDYVADAYGYEYTLQSWNKHLEEGWQGSKHNDYSLYLQKKGLLEKRDDKYIPQWFEQHGYGNGQGVDASYSLLSEEDTCEAWSARCSNDFIEDCVQQQTPFCCWMTVPRPHQTYLPAKKFWDLYDEDELIFPPNAYDAMEGRHPSAKDTQNRFQNNPHWMIYEPKTWDEAKKRVLRGYYACVTQVDDAVGRVLAKLDELGIRNQTIIVYASDHGDFAGEHGMIEKAPGIGFRCITRIPFLWSWPGHIPENVMRDSLVESVDFLPTVCSLAGISMPNWVDGKDLSPVLKEGGDIKDIAVTENPWTKTIHTKAFKFTQYLPEMNKDQEDFGELYDLQNDPWEMKNLYFEETYQSTVQELRFKLYCWLVRTTRHVTVNPWIPAMNDRPMTTWEFAKQEGITNEDQKSGEDFIRRVIQAGNTNYL
jgi:arylsulfatase